MKFVSALFVTATCCAVGAASIAATSNVAPNHIMNIPTNDAPNHFTRDYSNAKPAPDLRPLIANGVDSNVRSDSNSRSLMQTPESRREFLKSLHEAQTGLQSYNRDQASQSIERALELLNTPTEKRVINGYEEYKVIEVSYGASMPGEKALIPVNAENETGEAVRELVSGNLSYAGQMEDAEVKYLAFNLEKKSLHDGLTQAKAELAQDDFYGALAEIQIVHETVTASTDDLVAANTQAADHIDLAHALADQGEMAAARTALNKARVAYGILQQGTDDLVALQQLKTQLAALDATLAGDMPKQIALR